MRILTTVLFATLAASPLAASERCKVPEADWRPVEELKAELAAKGWTISNVKQDDGCYEVYAKDADGNRKEVYFDPKTFEEMGSDD